MSKFSTINSKEEQQLIDAVKKATDLVNAGKHPNDAIEKVSRDFGFGPGKIRVIGQGFNTGQQLAQWRSGSKSIMDKLASFDLCDPDVVIDRIYNGPSDAEKTASVTVDACYAKAPSFAHKRVAALEKTASYKLPSTPAKPVTATPEHMLTKALGAAQRAKQSADEYRRQAAAAADRIREKVAHLANYFRQASHARLSFSKVASAAETYIGQKAAMLLDIVYRQANCKEKRASDGMPLSVAMQPVNMDAAPFTLIRGAIDDAMVASRMQKLASEADAEYKKSKADNLKLFPSAALEAAEEREHRDLDGDGEKGESAEHKSLVFDKKAAQIFGLKKQAFGFGTEVAAIALGDIAAHKATHKPEEENDPFGDVRDLNNELARIRLQSQRAIGMRQRPAVKTAAEKKGFLGTSVGSAIGTSLGRTVGGMPKTKSDLIDDAWMSLEDPEHNNELDKIRTHVMLNGLLTDPDDPISSHDPAKVLSAFNEISSAAPRVARNVAILRPELRKRLEGHTEPFESKQLLDVEHGLAKTTAKPNTNIMGGSSSDSNS